MAVAGRVGIVFVSHSEKIADGLVELAHQMAQSVVLVAAGGTDDGGIGTSFTKISSAIQTADTGRGVAVFCDLGSAIMTAETALDFLDPEVQERVRIVDAPIVEGGVAAAVAAETGADLNGVVSAGASAYGEVPTPIPPAEREPYQRTVTLVNKDGLHARPAAAFVKLATTFPVRVTVNGKDAKSLLGIMSLGLVKGTSVQIASGEDGGEAAVDALAELIESGFGEES